MAEVRVITVRVSPEVAHRAEVVARADGVSVNEVFRLALEHYFQLKRSDPDFVARAQAMIARDAELVGGLS
jgi:predicted transcriptional regulator